jgi:protease-4
MRRRKHRLVLQVRLEEEVVEAKADPPLVGRSAKVDLRRVTRAIRQAAADRRVGGLMIRLAHPEIGWSKAASLSRAVRDFRSSGKPAVAFLEGAGNLDYSLACACETLVMQPGATLDLIGLRAEAFFFKDVLERFGIEAELESVGEYKSAAEMFVHRRMSPSYREALEALLTDLSEQMETAIAEGRSLSTARVNELISQGPFLAEEARELGLVDRVEHEDMCETLFQEKLGGDVVIEPQERYPVRNGWWRRLIGFRRPQIAVVYALGVIASGDHRRSRPSPRVVGARSFGEVLKRVRD